MNTTDIYGYLKELERCEWKDNAIVNGIKYNGISIEQGTETYQRILNDLKDKAEQSILSLSAESQNQILRVIYHKATEIADEAYDIIDQNTVEALKRDFPTNRTPEIKAEIELGQFVVDMHRLQQYYLSAFISFLENLLPTEHKESMPNVEVAKQPPQSRVLLRGERIIKGVKGLATYMGIGITKAQEILNSGILQEQGIAYRSGKAWRLNAEKLEKLLSEHPAIFRGIQQKGLGL